MKSVPGQLARPSEAVTGSPSQTSRLRGTLRGVRTRSLESVSCGRTTERVFHVTILFKSACVYPGQAPQCMHLHCCTTALCPVQTYPHDFTACPWLHPGERARRRDPRIFKYSSTLCPGVKKVSVNSPLWQTALAHQASPAHSVSPQSCILRCRSGRLCTVPPVDVRQIAFWVVW